MIAQLLATIFAKHTVTYIDASTYQWHLRRSQLNKNTLHTVQLEGNLIHARGCLCRIARVAMRASTIFYAGTRIHRKANN